MSVRYKLVYQNEIGSFEFSIENGAVIEKVTSLTQQNTTFETTASNREIGERMEHQRVEPKTLSIRGTLLGRCDAKREQMTHVIAPLSVGKLIYNDTYELTVYVKASPEVERYASNARFSFTVYAPYPYWQKKEKSKTTLAGLRGLFSFPWNISDPNPFRFSEYVEIGYVTVNNTGEAPAYWSVTFLALDEVTNPRIYNMETQEYVKILRTMQTGEQVTINTEGDELTVTITASDGTVSDGFQYLDVESIPFKLEVGENFIKTDAETNTAALRASISFHPAFVGV